jgi:hypothetical protein
VNFTFVDHFILPFVILIILLLILFYCSFYFCHSLYIYLFAFFSSLYWNLIEIRHAQTNFWLFFMILLNKKVDVVKVYINQGILIKTKKDQTKTFLKIVEFKIRMTKSISINLEYDFN